MEVARNQGGSASRLTRVWAGVLIGIGIVFWLAITTAGIVAWYVQMRGRMLEMLQSVLPLQVALWWDAAAFVVSLIAGGLLSLPLIIQGRFLRILLAQRDSLAILTERVASPIDLPVEKDQSPFGVLQGFLEEYQRLRDRAETAERQCERLRDEIARLWAENERYRAAREEIAALLANLVNDVLSRLAPPADETR